MAFREDSIPRTTYRYGQTRSVRGKRANQSLKATASGDQSWAITLGEGDSVFRILVAPDPAADVDRDIITARLKSTQFEAGAEDRAVFGTGGSSDYLTRTSIDFRASDTGGSISGWINPESTSANVIFVKYSSSTNRVQFYLDNVGGNSNLHMDSRISAGTTNRVRGNTTITLDTWHHVVVTSTGTAWALYVDGVLETLTLLSGSNTGDWFGDQTGTTINLGRNAAETTFLDGVLDEVGVFSSILTQAQITALYNLGHGLLFDGVNQSIPGLVHYWSLSPNHTSVGFDRIGGALLTNAGLDGNVGGIPKATRGYDRAVKFFGGTGSTLRATTVNLRPSDVSGSISVWLNKTAGTEPIFSKSTGTAANRFEVGTDSSNRATVRHTIASGTTNEIRGDTSIGTNTWGHIVVVSTGTAWAIYVNGIAQTLTVVTGSNTGDWFGDFVGTQWEVGRAVGVATELNGIADELGIWSTQLTAGNVTTLYNAGSGMLYDSARTISGIVHYWSFSIQHGGIGADRLGGVTLLIDGEVYDEVGITSGATREPYVNQFTFGVRNNEGFLELKDDFDAITWRMDDTGMRFEEGSTIVEAIDGEIIITTAGSDPDFTLQSLTVANALVYDNSVPEFRFFGDVRIDGTAGGRVTFALGSSIAEAADGTLTMLSDTLNFDTVLGSISSPTAIRVDDSANTVVILGDVTVNSALGGAISFAGGDYIQEEADGSLLISITGSDADLQINSNTLSNTVFYDRSAGTIMFLGTKIRMDSTGVADGGGFTFEPGGIFRTVATTGVTNWRSVGTNPDMQLGSTDFNNVFYWDFSNQRLSLIPDVTNTTLQQVKVGATSVVGNTVTSKLNVFQTNTTAAIGVLHLEQRDISEEFIQVVGNAAAATLTQSLVAVADVTLATLAGYLQINVQDDGNQIADGVKFIPFYTLI